MKVLWISPWFGNYRIPLYKELNRLCEGNFHLICSKENTSELVQSKLKKTLGRNALIMEGEQVSSFGNQSGDFANSGLVIKKQQGLYKAIVEAKPDVIITEGFGGWAPAGIRYAVTHRKKLCMFYERTEHVERNCPMWRKLYRRIVGTPVDCFLVNGTLAEEYLNKGLHFRKTLKVKGCMCADSFGLANAVANFSEEGHAAMRHELDLKEGITYLFVGQMVERKGVKELLSAWRKHTAEHPNDNLILVGEGILLAPMREQYGNLKSVRILGGVSYDEIYKYYAICDVYIMPTLEDNWCLVVPEAMACGKPVACSIYNGGHYELVKDGVDGYTFDPLNEKSILDTFNKLATADLKSMGERAKEIESDFTPDKAAKRIYGACKKVFGR